MELLLLSSSRANNSEYLAPSMAWITEHLKEKRSLLFVPYAGVTIRYDDYLNMVRKALQPLEIEITGIHQYNDPRQAVHDAEAIAIGGGNTFHLLHELYRYKVLDVIRQRVTAGLPYIGWSAGSNIAGQSIKTTNDMPIIEPPSFTALKLLPFQLNPHYSDYKPEGFHGETRDMRLAEFMQLNQHVPVVALPEGSALKLSADQLSVLGDAGAYLFKGGVKEAIAAGADLSALLVQQ
jgi:dipeptidase E